MAMPTWNVFVGAETGLLKGVNTHDEKHANVAGDKIVSRDKEINVMCWNNTKQSQVAIGRREQIVDIYDIDKEDIISSISVANGTGPLKGLCKCRGNVISCTESGHVAVTTKNSKQKHAFEVGPNIYRMRQSCHDNNILATGGKENNLKLWDLNDTSKPTFKAKNVSNDWLDLRVPIWVTDIQFMDNEKVMVSTGTHTVRIFDPKCGQRKPVLEASFDEYPFTCLAIPNDQNYAVVGNTKGNMALIDLRKKAMAHVYKGFAGSIRDIQCHPTEPIIASCGLDRFLRIHDFESRKLLRKIYLKSRLNTLLISDNYGVPKDDVEVEDTEVKEPEEKFSDEVNDKDDDKLWSTLKPVQIKRKKVLKKNNDGNLKKRLNVES